MSFQRGGRRFALGLFRTTAKTALNWPSPFSSRAPIFFAYAVFAAGKLPQSLNDGQGSHRLPKYFLEFLNQSEIYLLKVHLSPEL